MLYGSSFQKHWIYINTSVGPEWAEEKRYTGYSRNTVSMKNKLQRKAKKVDAKGPKRHTS